MTPAPDHAQRLAQAQARARRLRSEAFVRYRPVICGMPLEPMTLERYNLLVAFENGLVCGGTVGFEDLFAFIWVHQAEFGQFAAAARRRVLRRVLRALHPRWPTLNAVARLLSPLPRGRWLRRWCVPTMPERLHAAVHEARRMVGEALAEFPTGQAGGPPLPFALQAQILNLMRRELRLPFEETRQLPLKELAQHLRELIHTASGGKALLLTREEAAIWADYLADLNPKPEGN